MPFGKLADKTPYVTIKKPEEDLIYWVKRNLKLEQKAYDFLLTNKFIPMQTNNLMVNMDNAIDFLNFTMPKLG